MDEILEVSKTLWLVVGETSLAFDGLFSLRDDVGGNTLISLEEIPALIEVLRQVQARKETHKDG